MNFLLARVGPLEVRRAVQTLLRRSGGGEHWVCSDCEPDGTRARTRTLGQWQQRRGYGDDAAIRWPGQQSYQEEHGREEGSKSAWGLSWENAERGRRDEEGGTVDARGSAIAVDKGKAVSHLGTNFFDSPGLDPRAARNDSSDIESQVTLWERFESESAASAHSRAQKKDEIDDEATETSIPADLLLELDYKHELPVALRTKASDLVIRCLDAAAQVHDMDFLGSIPARMFSEILQLLEPTQFVARLGTAHLELSTALAISMNIAPMREVAFEYNRTLLRVLKIRRMTGHLPTIEDYELLLRSARLLGSHKMASIVWRSLLKDGLRPNTQCFNYYMASIVWNGLHSAGSRQKVRVVPFHMLARSTTRRDPRFVNYRIGEGGVKEETMKAFGEMLAFGAVADHESFQILVTACARDGDINTVKAILQRVWGINVDGIMNGSDEATIAPKSFSEHSPIRPRSGLLFALAHAFGINNDVPSALRVVDFVARHYDLEITPEIWNQLFEWTFVLADQRRPTAPENAGKLPRASVLSLWETMTGAPYFIKPTLGMYTRLISNLVDRRWTSKIVEVMREALPLYKADKAAADAARERLIADINRKAPDATIEKSRQRWEHANLIRTRNMWWLRRWVTQVLTSLNIRNNHDASKAKFLAELPRFLWEWRRYAPRHVWYETGSGFVELEFLTERDMKRRAGIYEANAERVEVLKEKSKRYVGNHWAAGYFTPERNVEDLAKRRRRKVDELEERKSRGLVDDNLAKELGGSL